MDRFVEVILSGWGWNLLHGLLVTMEISVGGYVVGLSIGSVVAWAKLRGSKKVVILANVYSTVCRSVPEILMVLVLYYAGQEALNKVLAILNVGEMGISGFAVAILVLGLVQGAYASEILRGAVLAIPRGQLEAAKAYGLHGFNIFRRTIAPLMLPHAFGGLSNLWMVILKDSVLVSVVGYGELTFTATQVAGATKMYFSFYLLLGAIYYALTRISLVLLNIMEGGFRRWVPSLK